jgi:hypothetical protein
MEYLVGVIVAVAVAGLATLVGFDRDRSFYPTVLIVVAAYYPLFAAMGASTVVLEMESAAGAGFLALALLGFKKNMWLVAAAIAGHGLFDAVHHLVIENPGVPVWWPGFCGSADVILGGWLAVRLLKVTDIKQGSVESNRG